MFKNLLLLSTLFVATASASTDFTDDQKSSETTTCSAVAKKYYQLPLWVKKVLLTQKEDVIQESSGQMTAENYSFLAKRLYNQDQFEQATAQWGKAIEL